ncbi:MAG: ABC transporter permease subunit [Oscillospiraceae bacterium]
MSKLLRANFARLWKDNLFRLCIAGMFIYGAVTAFSIYSDSKKYNIVPVTEKCFTGFIIPVCVLCAVLCSTLNGSENKYGTIRNKLTAGFSRTAVYLSEVMTCIAAGFAMCAAYILSSVPLGILTGKLCEGKYERKYGEITIYLLCGILLTAVCVSIFCLITVNIANPTSAAALCLFSVLLIIWITVIVYQALNLPEYTQRFIAGVGMTEEPVLNPRYPKGAYRSFLELLYDILPSGQAWQITYYNAKNLWRIPLCSLLISSAAVSGGALIFKNKDLK